MARRLHQTMADYVVIAISPALIMALVGSLVFFLLHVLYQGQFSGRLHWVVVCFVFASVLIGRISIEEGLERAAPFGIVLAIVVGIALNRFVEVKGGWISHVSWLVNYAMLGLVWWCAHRLTWDCTLIDDSQDASGEGLWQTAGFETPAEEPSESGGPAEKPIQGTTSRGAKGGWWQRYVENQRRPHAPGLWVVYFSLAALPLFGIGQWFIPSTDLAGRRYAFWLLCVYAGSGLGLLLTTSFLGLRRYLRQRRIEMPTVMANTWLGIGAALIIGLLVLSALLPRPSAEYAVSRLPFQLGSPDQKASPMAPVPKEGTADKQSGSAPKEQPKQDSASDKVPSKAQQNEQEGSGDNQNNGQAKEQSESPDEASQSDSQKVGASEQGGDKGKGGKQGQGESKPGKGSRPSKQSQSAKSKSPNASQQKDSSAAKAAQPNQDAERQPASADRSDRDENPQSRSEPTEDPKQPQQEQNPNQPTPNESQSQPTESPSATETPHVDPGTVGSALEGIAQLAQWAFYAVVAVAVLFTLWSWRAEIVAAIRDFWNELFGRKRTGRVSSEPEIPEFPPQPFSSYIDPFAAGTADRFSAEELVRYSFEAFEAWSREHGFPRKPDRTPHELARDVGSHVAAMAADARHLAELYSRAAYDRGTLPKASTEQLRQLWQRMRADMPSSSEFAPPI